MPKFKICQNLRLGLWRISIGLSLSKDNGELLNNFKIKACYLYISLLIRVIGREPITLFFIELFRVSFLQNKLEEKRYEKDVSCIVNYGYE